MRLEKLRLENFRCYEALDIGFDPQMTVIVGDNGKGKTAIFDAIAIAFAPFLEAFGQQGRKISVKDIRRVLVKGDGVHIDRMERRYPVVIKLEAEGYGRHVSCTRTLVEGAAWENSEESIYAYGCALKEAVDKGEQVLLPCLAYYGTSRIWVDSSLLKHYDRSLEDRSVGYEECLEPSSSYNTFGKWFELLSRYTVEEYSQDENFRRNQMIKNAVVQALNACLKRLDFENLSYDFNLKTFVISHKYMGEMIVDDLSDGFRSVISMAADIAYRMVRLNPFLEEKAVLETPGLVLIDEVDMHLHPRWQQTVLLDLKTAFPKVQFVVTTHSPQVLSSVDAAGIRILSWDEVTGTFEGVRCADFSLGANSYQLLQDIQNVDPRPEALPIVRDLGRYLKLVSEDKWDSTEALELRKKLDAWSCGKEPALLRADMDIRLRKFRRQRS